MFTSTPILVAIALVLGFAAGLFIRKSKLRRLLQKRLHADYYRGLNYLIDEKPDDAIDVFIQLLEVDNHTIETHLSLGNLFRRQGEIERAIRIHQNLIARPEIDRPAKNAAVFALAKDYFKAGVLDRAERLLLEMVREKNYVVPAGDMLLTIYEKEKAWDAAINFAKHILSHNDDWKHRIAQYYCELAERSMEDQQYQDADAYLRKARHYDRDCVRATLLMAKLEAHAQNWQGVIRLLKKVGDQNKDYIAEIVEMIVTAYRNLNDEATLLTYLEKLYARYQLPALLIAMTNCHLQKGGTLEAIDYMQQYLPHSESIQSLQTYLQLVTMSATQDQKKRLACVMDTLAGLLKKSYHYRCVRCGYKSIRLAWLCPSCRRWSTSTPIPS